MKILKWEFRKRVEQIGWMVALFLLLVGILFVLPPSTNEVNRIGVGLTFMGVVMSILGVYIVIIYPTYCLIKDLKEEYCVIEKLRNQSFFLTELIKIILNVLTVLVGSGLIFLASEVMKKFQTSNYKFFEVSLKVPFESLVFDTAVFIPVIAIFLYLFVCSIAILKNFPIVCTIVLLVFIYFVISISPLLKLLIVLIALGYSKWLYENKFDINS